MLKNQGGRYVHLGMQYQIPFFVQFDRLQLFANPFGKGGSSANKYRHIGPELAAEFGQRIQIVMQAPEMIQRNQGRRGIRGAATEPTACPPTTSGRRGWAGGCCAARRACASQSPKDAGGARALTA